MAKIKTIAEIGSNWNGNTNLAKKIILSAKKANIDFVKFQMWRANDLYTDSHPDWKFIKKSELGLKSAKIMKIYSDKIGIGCFWSVFYPEAVDYLESINVKLYKIASITSALKHKFALETLEKVAATKKPVIISMGLGGDLKLINKIFRNNKKIFLYCISDYPTKIKKIDFKNIQKFGGFSDHTDGSIAPILFALKCKNLDSIKYLEKHVSVDESVGPDKPFSISMDEYSNLVKDIKNVKFVNL